MRVIVLGMHKSGTTAVASTLHQSGFNLGYDLSVEDSDYKRHKSESRVLRAINDDILGSHNQKMSWLISNPDIKVLSNEIARQIIDFIREQEKFSNWALKDPRLTLTYHLWYELLPEHKIVGVYRDPDLIAQHYWKKMTFRTRLLYGRKILGQLNEKIILHNRVLLDLANTRSNIHLIEYEKLLKDKLEFDKLAKFIGVPLKNSFDVSNKRNMSKLEAFLFRIVCPKNKLVINSYNNLKVKND